MHEFRFHGRGGQGVVVLSKLVARLYFQLHKHVKEFPKFGVERRGAPVEGYVRVDDEPIDLNCQIYYPDTAVVMAESILDNVDVTTGMPTGGLILVNSGRPPQALAERLTGFRVATVDASGIALRHGLGTPLAPVANTTLFGAFARLMEIPLDEVEAAIRAELKRPDKNLAAARDAYAATSPAQMLEGARVGRPLPPARFKTFEELPDLAYSLNDARANKTGSWRSQRPVYSFKVAPCNARCPAGNDVRGFLEALAKDQPRRALEILLETSPFPGVCGRVCPHPCETECNRKTMDGAVPVAALERYAEAHGGEVKVHKARDTGKKVAIVGAGPAGLSAAWQLARRGHRVTVLEAASEAGGMLSLGIPAFRLPRDVIARELARILDLGVELRCNTRVGKDVSLESLVAAHDAVLLAVGQEASTELAAPGAKSAGVEQGLAFLRRHNLGQEVQVGKNVVVLGGGNTAIDVAGVALRKGRAKASEVHIVYRRGRAEMPAIAEEVDQVLSEGVHLVELTAPLEVLADAAGRVRALACEKMQLGEADASGRRRPVAVPGSRHEIPCDQVILAIGQKADLGFLAKGDQLLFPQGTGSVQATEKSRMSPFGKNLFACGDVSTGAGTVTAAIGSGRLAAQAIHQHLAGVWDEQGAKSWAPKVDEVLRSNRINPAHFAPRVAGMPPRLGVERRLASFNEVIGELRDGCGEAKRCLSCGTCTGCDNCYTWCPEPAVARHDGAYAINNDYCKGCGICVEECPRGVIDMVEERL